MTDTTDELLRILFLIHNLDPRTKLLCFATLCTGLAFSDPWPSLIVASALIFVVAITLPGLFWKWIFRLRYISWFGVIILVLHGTTGSGAVIFTLGDVLVTDLGLLNGTTLIGKIGIIFLLGQLLLMTTRLDKLVDALEWLGRPLQVRRFITTLRISMNFGPVLVYSARRMKMAHLARGADIEVGFLKKMKFAVSAGGPLAGLAFRISEDLALSMHARGFSSDGLTTSYARLRFTVKDYVTLLLAGLTTILTLTAG